MIISQKKKRLSAVRIIALLYLTTVLLSTFLLLLPFFHHEGQTLTLMDALFTASSAVSVTGLSVVAIHEVFNPSGIILLTFILQIGGIGIMTMSTFFWLLFRQKIGLEQRKWIATDHNRTTLSGLVSLMREILLLAIIIEIIGTLCLAAYFHYAGYHQSWASAFYYGFFSSISAFTNAGFDLYGISLQAFARDYVFQIIQMLLIVCGAIGFPVLVEVRHYLNRKREERFHFSLNTKITTVTFFSLLAAGALFFFIFERGAFLHDKPWHESIFYSLFQSVSARSAGLTTMDMSALSAPTLIMLSGLMFIGASPNSVGGGIRTTTFFVLIATTFMYMRGYKNIKVFGRELEEEDIRRSFIVFFVAIFLVFSSVILLTWIEKLPTLQILFEVCSAFGTTGSTMGITESLSNPGKLILVVLMVIGRIGILNFLLLVKKDEQPKRYHYPKEKIIIGQ